MTEISYPKASDSFLEMSQSAPAQMENVHLSTLAKCAREIEIRTRTEPEHTRDHFDAENLQIQPEHTRDHFDVENLQILDFEKISIITLSSVDEIDESIADGVDGEVYLMGGDTTTVLKMVSTTFRTYHPTKTDS